ncbi:MAG: hypothetical protein AB7K52_03090 [Phycisphaerales bacterium]
MLKLRASALALFALAGTVCATDNDLCTLPTKQVTVLPAGAQWAPRSEVNQLVFEITSPSDFTVAGNSRGTGGSAATTNDGSFPNYPPAQNVVYPIAANGFAFGWIAFGPAPDVAANFDYQCVFYDDIDMTIQAAAAPYFSNVLGTFRQNNIAPSWGFVQWFQDPLALVDGLGNPVTINFPDPNWGYDVRIFETGTNNLWHGAGHSTGGTPGNSAGSVTQIVPLARGGGGAAPVTGSSSPNYFRNDPAASDASLGVNQDTLNIAAFNAGNIASRRDIYIKLQSDIPAPPPPTFFDFITGVQDMPVSTLDCAGTAPNGADVSYTFAVNPAEARLVGFRLSGDASVDSNTFVDITTETDGPDMAMCLYNEFGVRLASDEDNGDLLNPQLTFGHGRRPAVGDSKQGNGRNGDLAAGAYYIGIGGFGTTFGSSGFNVNGAASIEFGNCTIRISHNTGGEACPLPAPVAPTAAVQGLLPAGVTTIAVAEVGFGEVQWMTFDTDYAVMPGDTSTFLDITTAGSDAVVDSEIGVFDSLGNRVADNDDGCGDFGATAGLSVLSFSDVGALSRPGIGTCLATGQSGDNLPAGTYYLCIGLFDTDFRDTGWQARSDSGSRLTVNVNFRTPAGCPADFNNDGNIDPDDLGDFINCYFGEQASPGSCPAADFNSDTSIDPDDLGDFINAYFSTVGVGC